MNVIHPYEANNKKLYNSSRFRSPYNFN
uniref:Uncharacterized protein n=1 Tax=Rhizophora mucronata TaxID=61149 RepID=A0A2P2NS03_RHIMU